MQRFSLVETDFVATVELSIAPNRPLKPYTLTFASGDLIRDTVADFIKKHSIPLYLELSILSTVSSVYERSVQKSRQKLYANDTGFDMQSLKASRRAFIDSYQQHTQEHHNKSAQVRQADLETRVFVDSMT